MDPEADRLGPIASHDPVVPAFKRVSKRVIRAFGPWNVAYLCSVPVVAATVPVFDALERASGTLGPDRLGAAVGSVVLWAAGSFLFIGLNVLRVVAWLIRKGTNGSPVSHALIGCVLPPAVLLASMAAVDVHDALTRPPGLVTRELAAPATIDGIAFAAGSVVEVEGSPPGRVVRGYAAAPTPIGGLTVVGEFELSFAGSDSVRKGRLAAAQPVDTVPCGPGVFHHDGDTVECTLAEPVAVDGATLAAGQQAGIEPGRDDAPARLKFGVLAEPADIGRLACAPGPVQASDRWTGCILAHDQEFGGLWLMGGTNAMIIGDGDGETKVDYGAVLARPVKASGVLLPRGTLVLRLPSMRGGMVGDGCLPDGISAAFRIPSGAVTAVLGGEVHGPMEIAFEEDRIEISRVQRDREGTFLLNGRRVAGARFDRRSAAWQVFGAED